eukprot:augustus_masked-scaffold_4-processed-gene-6.45-mRNA-1 protein AED:0.25 eAED:0.25 QI:0/0/0/0.5/1/1/2/0/251
MIASTFTSTFSLGTGSVILPGVATEGVKRDMTRRELWLPWEEQEPEHGAKVPELYDGSEVKYNTVIKLQAKVDELRQSVKIMFNRKKLLKFFERRKEPEQFKNTIVLTPEQIEEFKTVFNQFDNDGSGNIDASELGDAMRSLGQSPSRQDLEDMIAEVDKDSSGTIDFKEFLGMMREMMQDQDDEDDIFESLQLFTEKKKGTRVQANYLRKALITVGDTLTEEDVEFVFNRLTIDKDGFIEIRELAQLLVS